MVFERIRGLVRSQLDYDGEITPETDLFDDIGLGSVDMAELIVLIEEEFQLLPAERAAQDIHTVGELAALVEQYIR